MTKGEITFPNEFYIIKDRKYDRDVLGSLQWKWATIVKKIAAGRTTDDLCLIAGTTGDFYFSTQTTSSIVPTNHLFFHRRLFPRCKTAGAWDLPFLLSCSVFKVRGAVLPQFQIPPCRIKESPVKILRSNPYYVYTKFQFSALSVSEKKWVRSINNTMTDFDVIY